ncbi:Tex family protein [Pelagicoccus mobilis]|uniref:RNA-binding transcriptional accessory protein n=1 Tax=Pelagicoccus mobilis TaxID=415221 RepID=A0A934VMZ7_9BACT|nr:Tex family protein [Pelagicoccus mobilis]MBK1875707.1 RNA-binding transcriptional accessory protein [Pelagicoccus mobilis]
MHEDFLPKIADELSIPESHVAATAKLIVEGATVPFIARYRKEATGGLDEVQIANIRDRLDQLKALEDRRSAILKSLEDQKVLTDSLKAKVMAAETMARLEDVYLPYKPKRRTKATIAREKGLEPLADKLFNNQEDAAIDPNSEAAAFVDAEKEVADSDAALAGARDIIAEWINDDADSRAELRELYTKKSTLTSRVMMGKEEEGAKYRDYFEWSEPIADAPSHRILAIRRGEQEMMLSMSVRPDEELALAKLESRFVKGSSPAAEQVRLATKDAFKRLLAISMETAARLDLKKRADAEAITVFASNIRELLLAPALGEKPIIAIDPGFRTGCKTVVLDAQGKLLFDTVIYPTQSQRQIDEARTVIAGLAQRFESQAIAIGNGTASRETEAFVRSIGLPKNIAIVMVNESGASIYSASEVARDEFPDKDITVRGAVSIGRRLMDPLAELVKIDPKSIGVGQYQHDVDQRALKASLDDTVLSCVNAVGVEVNTASKQLLSYVSGLNSRLAGNIVAHREANGPFKSRKELTKVSGIGPKAFEQAAGFLRIRGAENPLDASAVHPERYPLLEQMATDLTVSVKDLMTNSAARNKIDIQKYTTDEVGLPTLQDIMQELAKPGRDPRAEFELVQFKEGVNEITDLQEGMKLTGVVTNVTAFGAFIDIGVHQDGLAHISQLSDSFVKDPNEVVKVGQKVSATVTEVDVARKRIGLSLKSVVEIDRRSPAERAAERGNRGGGHQNRGGNRNHKPRGGNRSGGGNRGKGNQNFGSLGDAFGNLKL